MTAAGLTAMALSGWDAQVEGPIEINTDQHQINKRLNASYEELTLRVLVILPPTASGAVDGLALSQPGKQGDNTLPLCGPIGHIFVIGL